MFTIHIYEQCGFRSKLVFTQSNVVHNVINRIEVAVIVDE